MTVTVSGGITFSGGGFTFTPAAAAANDPYFMYNSLLLPGDGTNLAQNNTFLDGSTNNFTITRNGNTTQGTFSPYGANWSNYFDGNGDYLTTPASVNMNIGTGDFTFETWIFPTITSAGQALISFANTNVFYLNSSNIPCYGIYFVSDAQIGSTAVALNTWSHIAFVRSGTTLTCYINGTSVGSITTASSIGTSVASNYIGSHQGGNYWNGYLSNARVVKGTAVYTGNFTPSTTPLTAVTNTSLLTCQSNRFIDNSSNAFAITVNGNTNIQRFSPFSPTATYSAATTGGSGYFDGTGDYLTIAGTSTACALPGDFTIECWYYQLATTNYGSLFSTTTTYSTANSLRISTGPTNNTIQVASAGSAIFNASTTFTPSTWVHFALVRSGSTVTLYQNGVSVGSATNSQSFVSDTFIIGDTQGVGAPYYLNGYISNFRVVKGTAVYTTAFTPPTSPVTAIANTSLLLNYTNAGIIDNAMMNNLETVGNAQISTAQSKFGGSSMAFDGTGDYLPFTNSLISNFGTGDFTFECWVYKTTSSGGDQVIIDARAANNATPWLVAITNANLIYFYSGTAYTTSSSISLNTWSHIAVSRSSGTLKIFIDGVSGFSGSVTTNLDKNAGGKIGSDVSGNAVLYGYIDDLRITKGYARYTANFTPPTQALPTY